MLPAPIGAVGMRFLAAAACAMAAGTNALSCIARCRPAASGIEPGACKRESAALGLSGYAAVRPRPAPRAAPGAATGGMRLGRGGPPCLSIGSAPATADCAATSAASPARNESQCETVCAGDPVLSASAVQGGDAGLVLRLPTCLLVGSCQHALPMASQLRAQIHFSPALMIKNQAAATLPFHRGLIA